MTLNALIETRCHQPQTWSKGQQSAGTLCGRVIGVHYVWACLRTLWISHGLQAQSHNQCLHCVCDWFYWSKKHVEYIMNRKYNFHPFLKHSALACVINSWGHYWRTKPERSHRGDWRGKAVQLLIFLPEVTWLLNAASNKYESECLCDVIRSTWSICCPSV